jgi:hypothetical protein
MTRNPRNAKSLVERFEEATSRPVPYEGLSCVSSLSSAALGKMPQSLPANQSYQDQLKSRDAESFSRKRR